jgi:hypothetical protein
MWELISMCESSPRRWSPDEKPSRTRAGNCDKLCLAPTPGNWALHWKAFVINLFAAWRLLVWSCSGPGSVGYIRSGSGIRVLHGHSMRAHVRPCSAVDCKQSRKTFRTWLCDSCRFTQTSWGKKSRSWIKTSHQNGCSFVPATTETACALPSDYG